MTRRRLRSALITGTVLALLGLSWWHFAPATLGGRTTYVVTSGVSMAPSFHTGDLALVRPAADYRVGEIVAYHSSVLHEVVLHRIIAIRAGHYVFKGDNNNFIDPVRPPRSELVGRLWLHLPRAGVVLDWLHRPLVGALLAAAAGLIVLTGLGTRRRRSDRPATRRAGRARPGAAAMTGTAGPGPGAFDLRVGFAVAAGAAVLLLGLALFAFTRPLRTTAAHRVPYAQRVTFGYSATAPAGAVYPTGAVHTGEPVFLQLVHRLQVQARYRLTTAGAAQVHGTASLAVRLSGPTGWSRTLPLGPARTFTGTRAAAAATLDLPALEALFAAVQKQTGMPASGGDTIAVVMRVRVYGTLAGRPIADGLAPQLSFSLQPLALQPGGSPAAPSPAAGTGATATPPGDAATGAGSVTTVAPAANRVSVVGLSLGIAALRWLTLAGLLISGIGAAVLGVRVRRSAVFGEPGRIQAHYGHMIVPIVAGEDLGWPAVDVASMKSLVRLAEASGQLILHSRGEEADTYLVNDEGTVYRYQAKLPKIAWSEWTEPTAGEVTG